MSKKFKPKSKNQIIYEAYKPFYEALIAFFESLDKSSTIKYCSTQKDFLLHDKGGKKRFNKHYRAIYEVSPHVWDNDIEKLEQLYYNAIKKIDPKKYNPKKPPKLPIYFPKLADPNIVKCQIHENKAHSSENFKKDENVAIIRVATKKMDHKISIGKDEIEDFEDIAHMTYEQFFEHLKLQFAEQNINTSIVTDDDANTHEFKIDVSSLCDVYKCDSVQLRTFTGRQIRANFFTLDEDGFLQKSKLESVGVLLLTSDAEVYKSHRRSRRSDAIYTPNHDKEIPLEVPKSLALGRLYKVEK